MPRLTSTIACAVLTACALTKGFVAAQEEEPDPNPPSADPPMEDSVPEGSLEHFERERREYVSHHRTEIERTCQELRHEVHPMHAIARVQQHHDTEVFQRAAQLRDRLSQLGAHKFDTPSVAMWNCHNVEEALKEDDLMYLLHALDKWYSGHHEVGHKSAREGFPPLDETVRDFVRRYDDNELFFDDEDRRIEIFERLKKLVEQLQRLHAWHNAIETGVQLLNEMRPEGGLPPRPEGTPQLTEDDLQCREYIMELSRVLDEMTEGYPDLSPADLEHRPNWQAFDYAVEIMRARCDEFLGAHLPGHNEGVPQPEAVEDAPPADL